MCASKQILKNKPPLSFPEGDDDFLELDEFNLWTGKTGGQQNIPFYVSIILKKMYQLPKCNTVQKMKLSIKDLFSKYDPIHSFLQIWSYLLKKYLMKNFIFCAK